MMQYNEKNLLYHHAIDFEDLEDVGFGELIPDPEYSEIAHKDAYSWLEREIGFYPLFLSVGTSIHDIRITGYDNPNISKIASRKIRSKKECRNKILFSFEHVDGVFIDLGCWDLPIVELSGDQHDHHKEYQLSEYWKKRILQKLL